MGHTASAPPLRQYVRKDGDIMTGPLLLAGNATQPLQSVPLQQLQAAIEAIPADKYVQSAQSYDAATNTLTLLLSDGSTVSVDMTELLADAIDARIQPVIVAAGLTPNPADSSQLLQAIKLLGKPVGTVEVRYDMLDPADLYGGTWELLSSGRALVTLDAGDADFDAIGKTGGDKSVTLTSSQLPNDLGLKVWGDNEGSTPNGQVASLNVGGVGITGAARSRGYLTLSGDGTKLIDRDGGGEGHNNLQPFVVVRAWRRTA